MSDYKFSLFIILGKSVITIQKNPTHLALNVIITVRIALAQKQI